MKDKPIKQPWPRSAKITVWVLSLILVPALFYAVIVDPNPCRHQPVAYRSPYMTCRPLLVQFVYKLKDQRTKHPEDFPLRKQEMKNLSKRFWMRKILMSICNHLVTIESSNSLL